MRLLVLAVMLLRLVEEIGHGLRRPWLVLASIPSGREVAS